MSQGITQKEVAEAMNSLLDKGQEPSVRAVREVLRTGSFSTISKFMSAVRLERSTPAPDCDVPPQLSELLQRLTQEIWKAARVSARKENELLRGTMHEKSYSVEASLAQVRDLISEIGSDMSDLHQCADQAMGITTQGNNIRKDKNRPLADRGLSGDK